MTTTILDCVRIPFRAPNVWTTCALCLCVRSRCIAPHVAFLPALMIHAELPSLHVSLSQRKVSRLVELMHAFTTGANRIASIPNKSSQPTKPTDSMHPENAKHGTSSTEQPMQAMENTANRPELSTLTKRGAAVVSVEMQVQRVLIASYSRLPLPYGYVFMWS